MSTFIQIIRFARESSHVTDFNARYKILTGKILHQGYRHHKLQRLFLNFIADITNGFQNSIKSLLQHGLSEPKLYGDLVYKLRQIVSRADFSEKLSCVTNVMDKILM